MLESLKSLAPICLNVNAPDFIPPTLKSLSSTFENIRPDIKGTFICMQILQRNWGAPKEYNLLRALGIWFYKYLNIQSFLQLK